MSRTTVSVIIPCYNQARFLPDAVASVRVQSYPQWECIIVNDGSTDDTSGVARMLASSDPRIQVIEQSNKGLSGARNAGLRIARGHYIQFLDADDLIEPNKLQAQFTALAATSGLALSYSDYRYCPEGDVTATTTRDSFPPPRFITGKALWDIASRWETEFSIPVHCFLFDARFFIDRGISFDETLPNHEDWDCWMQIFALEPLVSHVPEPLAIYRLHDNAMCMDLEQLGQGFDMALRKQLRIFRENPEMQKRLLEKRSQMRRLYGIRTPLSALGASGRILASLYRRLRSSAIREFPPGRREPPKP